MDNGINHIDLIATGAMSILTEDITLTSNHNNRDRFGFIPDSSDKDKVVTSQGKLLTSVTNTSDLLLLQMLEKRSRVFSH
jgi:hypothetical protein